MITVRFPNGQAIQYNTGWYIVSDDTGRRIYTDSEKKSLIAIVPLDCAIELVPACRFYDGMQKESSDARIAEMSKELRGLRRDLRALKKGIK